MFFKNFCVETKSPKVIKQWDFLMIGEKMNNYDDSTRESPQ